MKEYLLLSFLVVMAGTVAARSSFFEGFEMENKTSKMTCDGIVGGSQYCIDCETQAFCDAAGTATPQQCPLGTFCIGYNSPHMALCEDTVASGSFTCTCDPSATTTTFVPDPYDITKYITCLLDGSNVIRISGDCPSGQIFDPAATTSPPCVEPETQLPSCTYAGQTYPILPACEDYIYCEPGNDGFNEIRRSCSTAGDMFNEVTNTCENPINVDGPVCTLQPDGARVADTVDCSRYHICLNNLATGTDCCMNNGEVFSPTLQKCTADVSSVSCPVYPICYTLILPWCQATTTSTGGSSSTSAPQSSTTGVGFTCTSEGKFPDPTDCHKFYSCVESPSSSGNYIQSRVTCPGGLIFSPSASSCMDEDQIPECKLSAEELLKRQTCALCA